MAIRTISFLTRLKPSVNGNPRFRIHFDDGSSAITSSDAMFCYGLENRENIGQPVEVTFTRAVRVSDVRIPKECKEWRELDKQFKTDPRSPLHHDNRCSVHNRV